MHRSAIHRSCRGNQSLACHLPAEDALAVLVGGGATEDVDLYSLKVQEPDHGVESCLHTDIMPLRPPYSTRSASGTLVAVWRSTTVLARLRREHGARVLRYCGVSVVNVTVGSTTLAICHAVFGWRAVLAGLAAWMASTIPAYLLSRAWVWGRDGPHRLGSEVAPFWVMALIGLGFSSLAVELVERAADRTIFVLMASLSAHGVVWVAKYLYLDKLLWPRIVAPAEVSQGS